MGNGWKQGSADCGSERRGFECRRLPFSLQVKRETQLVDWALFSTTVLQPVSPKPRLHHVGAPIAHAGQHITLTLYGRTWPVLMASRRRGKITAEQVAEAFALSPRRLNVLWAMLRDGTTFEDYPAVCHSYRDSTSRKLPE